MPRSQPREKRNIWEFAETRIGVASAVVGLVVALVGLPKTIASSLGRTESAASKLELRQKRAALAAAAPRLDVRYVFLSADIALNYTDLALKSGSPNKQSKQSPAVTSILSMPTTITQVIPELKAIYDRVIDHEGGGGCRFEKIANISTAFLVISNRGSRDASNVSLRVAQLRLRGHVRILERAPRPEDYAAKLRARAASVVPMTIPIPFTFGPGDGVRVPLLVSDAASTTVDKWCVVSQTVLLPSSVRYDDPVLGNTVRFAVRRMQTPTLIAPGAYARG